MRCLESQARIQRLHRLVRFSRVADMLQTIATRMHSASMNSSLQIPVASVVGSMTSFASNQAVTVSSSFDDHAPHVPGGGGSHANSTGSSILSDHIISVSAVLNLLHVRGIW